MSSYTVELECSIEDSLRTLALSKGTSISDILKRSILTYKVLSTELARKPGSKLSITDSDDDVLKDIVLF